MLSEVAKWYISTEDIPQFIKDIDKTHSIAIGTSSIRNTLLVHGSFGCGKTYLLATIIQFMSTVLDAMGDKTTKILIASHTNVAVDCVLLALLYKGFFNFGRVGSIKKINKLILPYSLLHKKSDTDEKEELSELNHMLEDVVQAYNKAVSKKEKHLLEAEKEAIEESIKLMKSTSVLARKEIILAKRVIGVTISSCNSQYLASAKFSYVLLDECSQMIEPQSFIPLYKFNAEKLVNA